MLQNGNATVRCPKNPFGSQKDAYTKCSGELHAHFGAPRTDGRRITNGQGIERDVEWTIYCPDCKTYLQMRGSLSGTDLSIYEKWLTDENLDREEAARERARIAARTWRRIIGRLAGNVWRTLRYFVVSTWTRMTVRG